MLIIRKILSENRLNLMAISKRNNQVTFTCPECGEPNTYFCMSPYNCDSCKKSLPDITNYIESGEARTFYHKKYKEVYSNKDSTI